MQMHSGDVSQILSDAFDEETQKKHDFGTEKYGTVRFMQVDSIAMAMEEIVDLSNYARFTWIKLAMLQQMATKFEQEFGAYLRHKDDFKNFMTAKGIDIDEPVEFVDENPGKGADVKVDNGVSYTDAAQQEGFFNPFRNKG